MNNEIIKNEVEISKIDTPPIFPNFDSIKVNTKTIIAMTNTMFNLQRIYDILPVTEYFNNFSQKGKKRKLEQIEYNKSFKDGTIITLKYYDKVKGNDLKKKSKKKNKGKYFRNSITVVMIIDGKLINYKISKNKSSMHGKFQITGCRNDIQAESCIQFIWKYIKDDKEAYTFLYEDYINVMFIPAMRNINLKIPMLINREALCRYINKNTKHIAILELSMAYTGLISKFKLDNDITQMGVKYLNFKDEVWTRGKGIYNDFLNELSSKEKEKKLNKKKCITFLIFQSGSIIMSGINREYMRDPYNEFVKIITDSYHEIKETTI
jgi:hypothetical protein